MGNSNSKNRIIVKTPFDLPEHIRNVYINKLVRYIDNELYTNGWAFTLYDTDVTTIDEITYQITSIIGVIPEVMRQLQLKSLWSYSVGCSPNGITLEFKRILNTDCLTIGEEIPTHVANQIMRSAIEEEETCSITFAPLNEETVVLTSCGHLFSKEGLTTWFQTRSLMEHNCPTCSKHVMKVYSLSL